MEAQYKQCLQQVTRLAESEMYFYSQSAKAAYLKGCDRNTKFFNDLVKRNKKKNDIVAL